MRLGIVCDREVKSVADEVCAVERAGLDLAWLTASSRDGKTRSASVLAASLAQVTEFIRLAIEMPLGRHPIEIAEELAVTDLLVGGRLTGVLTDADGETMDVAVRVIRAALSARPFDPATGGPPTGEGSSRHAVRVTPAPAQLEFPLWLQLPSGQVVSQHGALPAVRNVPVTTAGRVDTEATVAMLVHERAANGLDVCVLRLPDTDQRQRFNAIEAIALRVRPQIQLDSLPSGLVQVWDRSATTE